MIIVNAAHWLDKDLSLPRSNLHARRLALRMARFIEYGGTLSAGHARETLVECRRRPKRRQCPGVMWVSKTDTDEIQAFCIHCHETEMVISNWQETEWADGMMVEAPMDKMAEKGAEC